MNLHLHYRPGNKIGGRYQVHQALMGGMGEVYLCLDLETTHPYALKTFQQRYQTNTQRVRQAFEQEVATWVALEKHPNIVRCFYMDILDNQPFMVLEWIAGEEGRGADLRGWLRRGPLDLRQALNFTIDICRGLLHAQEKRPGLVHRDLKPENVLIAQGNLAKITDFGLVQIVQEARAELDTTKIEIDKRQMVVGPKGIAGTPAYMAPEQWHHESLDERTDVYALGCMLYEMLTGQRPFRATTLDSLRRQHLGRDAPRLTTDDLWADTVNSLLTYCLAKKQVERFSSVDELLNQLVTVYEQQFEKPPPMMQAKAFSAMDYGNRGSTYGKLKRYAEALIDFDRAIQIDPDNPLFYVNRGGTYTDMRQYDRAFADFDRAMELDPKCALAYSNRGGTYGRLERNHEALADLTYAIELNPTYAPAYTHRGTVYERLQKYEESLADHTHAIYLDPKYAIAYVHRGNMYDKLGKYCEALADYEHAIDLDPACAPAYYNRAVTLSRLQKNEDALENLDTAIEFDPSLVVAYIHRGHVRRRLKNYDNALADYGQVIELDPSIVESHYHRGITYADLGQIDNAIHDLTRAIELDSGYVPACHARGVLFYELHQHEKALEDLNHVIQLGPVDVYTYYNRGNIYLSLGHYDKALADYILAICQDPSFADVYMNMGALLNQIGARREAASCFEKAAELGHLEGLRIIDELGEEFRASPQFNYAAIVLDVILAVSSPDEMRNAAKWLPLMSHASFISGFEDFIQQHVPLEHRPAFEQRLAWLQQIANEQK